MPIPMNDKIIKKAKELGLTEVGFCFHKNRSAIAVLFPYRTDTAGNLSIYTRGFDYHIIVKKMLTELISPFTDNFEIFVDIGPSDNIAVAKKCGLGIVGKNNLLINENLGSFFFIGYVLCDLDITPSVEKEGTCFSCNACIKACPGGALTENGFIIENCASHISQKKGDLTDSEINILKKSGLIFGCDICQSVCPMNKNKATALPQFCDSIIESLTESDLDSLSERSFKEKYGDRAFSWRGKKVLLRNIEILKKGED